MVQAIEDATNGRFFRSSKEWRTGRNRSGGHMCLLCSKGPMQFVQWQIHQNSMGHVSKEQEYEL